MKLPHYTIFGFLVLGLLGSCSQPADNLTGQTEITKWRDNKKAAISLTYDDGTINQFTVARPIMNKLDFPGTFYIITGKIPGSKNLGKFIGRDSGEIISETAQTPTSSENFFERASAIGFTGHDGAIEYHTNAGSRFDSGNADEAYALIDEGYAKIRNGEMKKSDAIDYNHYTTDTTTWEEIRTYATEGHEFGSHTITHPRLAALDETNMLYELEKSREDILNNLGEEHTFSAECPYGTENERVMEYAHTIYPSLRNRMPETWLEELNRGSKINPGESSKEYVQWQRGPVTSVSMEKMKSWVDTVLVHDNVWLVLVFHGVDGIGWEARTAAELEEYFDYMKEKEEDLWVATFAEVTKYLRERNNASVNSSVEGNSISVEVTHTLDPKWYKVPLTLKTYVPSDWASVSVKLSDGETSEQSVMNDEKGSFVLYNCIPGEGQVILEKI